MKLKRFKEYFKDSDFNDGDSDTKWVANMLASAEVAIDDIITRQEEILEAKKVVFEKLHGIESKLGVLQELVIDTDKRLDKLEELVPDEFEAVDSVLISNLAGDLNFQEKIIPVRKKQ